ncbi:MAG: SIS domain-containing protein [Verrucomicrobiaceae bacterium]|nr:SIS domain-containing protein [Verrucomicrobiaceae bacterium]
MKSELDAYLAVAGLYQLGGLDTEAQHPFTVSLSHLAKDDLGEAVRELHRVDVLAMRRFEQKAARIPALAAAIEKTLLAGRRIFLCGCGATGRLSMSLEVFCREGMLPPAQRESVIAFMAGGDLALIKAIENFEDHPEFGRRQLDELGFAEGDLLISSTEGGETPFVIGATERAAEVSSNAPWFLYCNPDDKLTRIVDRSRRVIEDRRIEKMNLAVGPMAISGSTRMQASTVLMAAIGFALLHRREPQQAQRAVTRLRELVESLDFAFLQPFVEKEAAAYEAGEFVIYESGRYGVTVVTDTTERAPTFSLPPFENLDVPAQPASWCYFHMSGQPDAAAAWRALLHRAPRTLDWPEVRGLAGAQLLGGYDFSDQLLAKRAARTRGARHHVFRVLDKDGTLVFDLDGMQQGLHLHGVPDFSRHLILKMALNIHSTLVMGRLGRYLDNLMTWVKPSNNKLIDRSIRYVTMLVQRRTGKTPAYDDVARALFAERAKLKIGEPIVLKTMDAVLEQFHAVAHA